MIFSFYLLYTISLEFYLNFDFLDLSVVLIYYAIEILQF